MWLRDTSPAGRGKLFCIDKIHGVIYKSNVKFSHIWLIWGSSLLKWIQECMVGGLLAMIYQRSVEICFKFSKKKHPFRALCCTPPTNQQTPLCCRSYRVSTRQASLPCASCCRSGAPRCPPSPSTPFPTTCTSSTASATSTWGVTAYYSLTYLLFVEYSKSQNHQHYMQLYSLKFYVHVFKLLKSVVEIRSRRFCFLHFNPKIKKSILHVPNI